jgi:hypothetical protein
VGWQKGLKPSKPVSFDEPEPSSDACALPFETADVVLQVLGVPGGTPAVTAAPAVPEVDQTVLELRGDVDEVADRVALKGEGVDAPDDGLSLGSETVHHILMRTPLIDGVQSSSWIERLDVDSGTIAQKTEKSTFMLYCNR